MTRWISSDESTALALRRRQLAPENGSGDTITDALHAGSAVVMMPGAGGDVLVARFRRRALPASEEQSGFEVHRWTDESAVGYTAGGMLGLFDEPVYEQEPQERPKKRWWQKSKDE
jgi:hypothetical protein